MNRRFTHNKSVLGDIETSRSLSSDNAATTPKEVYEVKNYNDMNGDECNGPREFTDVKVEEVTFIETAEDVSEENDAEIWEGDRSEMTDSPYPEVRAVSTNR